MKPSKYVQSMQSSYIREILKAAKSDNVISLAGGLPDSQHLPVDLLTTELQNLSATPEVFQYGETPGYGPLLDFLTESYNLADSMRLMITNGSQQGLDLIARAFIEPDDKVVMEAPSYLGAIQTFGLARANILTITQNTDGPDLTQLEAVFRKDKPKVFYAVPDFHNPTGVCWSLATRQQVAKLCIAHDVVLVEDAPYRELRFSGEPLPMASTFCREHSIVLRSFSKISAPGMRLGAVHGPNDLIDVMLKVKQAADLHTGQPLQAALLGLLQNPSFEGHLNKIRSLYAQRYSVLSEALSPLKDLGYKHANVEGGMFVWLSLANGNANNIAKSALENGVAVVPSDAFYLPGTATKPSLRLNFSHSDTSELVLAIDKLKHVLV